MGLFMSTNNNNNQIKFEKINKKLDILVISHIIPIFEKNREKKDIIIKKIVSSPGKKNIWKLCDGNHTVSQIAEELGRLGPSISRDLTPMIEGKIVFELLVGSEKYPLAFDKLINYIVFSKKDEFIFELFQWIFQD